jgi:RimJ/RimL family protein N-acetyltransferase
MDNSKKTQQPQPVARTDLLQHFAEPAHRGSQRAPWVSAIRHLGPKHRQRIAQHLFKLDEHDRYLRFGYLANDEQIQRYVDGLDFERDDIFGIYDRRLELIAMAHLAHSVDAEFRACAEFGVSVANSARGRGYGSKLFERAVKHARNEGVMFLFIHALSENSAMLKIAKKSGAMVAHDGPQSNAYLTLPPATFDSRMTELVQEQLAQTNYRLKVQVKQFWKFLRELQEVRRGVQEARHKSGQ